MDNAKDLIRDVIAKMTPDLSEKDKKKQEEVLYAVFEEGKLLKDALNISDQTIEYLYSQAYKLYKIGKYSEASRYFHILYLLNALDLRFSMGIAASHHMLKEYQKAVEWYMVCAALDENSPLPYYHISDCFLKMGEKVSALISLKMLQVRLDDDDPRFAQIKEKSARMIDVLSEELNNRRIEEQREADSGPVESAASQEAAKEQL